LLIVDGHTFPFFFYVNFVLPMGYGLASNLDWYKQD